MGKCCGQSGKSNRLSIQSNVNGSSNTMVTLRDNSRIAPVKVLIEIPIPRSKMPTNAPYKVNGREWIEVYRKDLEAITSLTDNGKPDGNPAFATKEQYEAMQSGGDSVEFAVQVESAESSPITVNFAEFKGISEKTSDILNDAGYTLETLKAANEDNLIELGLKSRQAKIAISAVNKDGE